MGKRRDPPPSNLEDDAADSLIQLGKQLQSLQKTSKDSILKILKEAAKVLEDVSQDSEHLKLASSGICKALGKNDLLKHKDKRVIVVYTKPMTLQEVRLYAAVCAVYTLRLHAPENPYTDAQMEVLFRLLLTIFKDLNESTAAHFRVCLSLLETTAQIKICLLMLDLDNADSLVLDLFNTLFESINEENQSTIESPTLEVLSIMIDESDDIPQPLLDCILGHLLPSTTNSNPASHTLAQQLLRRSQTIIQPYVQKFLTQLLEGRRVDSDLSGNCSELILQVHQAAPQIMLPVMPHLQPSLQVEAEERRLDAVDLICALLTSPGGRSLLSDYPSLPEGVLGRLNDRSTEVRARVLSHAKSLVDAFHDEKERRKIVEAVAQRLQDPEERIRSAAAASLCNIAAKHPHVPRTAEYHALVSRLRDKRLAVRNEVATQIAKLIKVWSLQWENGNQGTVRKGLVVELAVGLCTLALTRDTSLAAHILDDLFKGGVFPSKLSPESSADWWSLMWKAAGEQGRTALCTLLRGKCDLQRQLTELLRVREAIKDSNNGGSGNAVINNTKQGGNDNNNTDNNNTDNNNNNNDTTHDDMEQQFKYHLSILSSMLRDINRAEEGVQRLFTMKDNHIFRGLSVLSTFGTSFADAMHAAKDIQSRVGSRGPVADVLNVLCSRLTPNIISPEVLVAAIGLAHDNEDAHRLVMDVASCAPQLFSRSLPAVAAMFEMDDPLAAETGAKILAAVGSHITIHYNTTNTTNTTTNNTKKKGTRNNKNNNTSNNTTTDDHDDALPEVIVEKLKDMCLNGSPTGAKAAVKALVHITTSTTNNNTNINNNTNKSSNDTTTTTNENAYAVLQPICKELLSTLWRPSTLKVHSRILSSLKALSMACRLIPELLEELSEEMYECVMSFLIHQDLSMGKPLPHATDTSKNTTTISPPSWGKPSADIAIKSAAIKTLAQAFVPDNPDASSSCISSDKVKNTVKELVIQLTELTDIDTSSTVFADFHWVLEDEPAWRRKKKERQERSGDRKRKAHSMDSNRSNKNNNNDDDDDDDEMVNIQEQEAAWNAMTEEEQDRAIQAYKDASPDAGWLRSSAAAALFRLCRAYDPTMTGNEYLTLGLACQDPVEEARRALLEKIAATVNHFQTVRSNPQRAAKFAALYALYGADPCNANIGAAQGHLRTYVAGRRTAVERSALATAAAGESGTLVNELPEFILPFLIYFMSHHPDYDSSAIFQDYNPDDEDIDAESPIAFLLLFLRGLQLALEVLLLPRNAALGSEQGAVETSRQAGATFKILRQLKFCDVLEVEDSKNIDDAATTSAHQLCDIALSLSRQVVHAAMGSKRMSLQKFPGSISLPKMCFRPRKNLSSGDKRGDYSDLPTAFRPTLHRPLFAAAFGYVVKARSPGVRNRGRGMNNKSGRGDVVVEQKKAVNKKVGTGGGIKKKQSTTTAAAKKKRQSKKKSTVVGDDTDIEEQPLRHQPRRNAKDAAGEKLKVTTPHGEDFEDSFGTGGSHYDDSDMSGDESDGGNGDRGHAVGGRMAGGKEKSGLITAYLRPTTNIGGSGSGGVGKGKQAMKVVMDESDDDAGFVVSPESDQENEDEQDVMYNRVKRIKA